MCRWGCPGIDSTFMCKWCGTRYCRECQKGEFSGTMLEENRCRQCNQVNCQGQRVEFVIKQPDAEDAKSKKGAKKVDFARSRSKNPTKTGSKGAKSSKTPKTGKKSSKKSSSKMKASKKKKKKK